MAARETVLVTGGIGYVGSFTTLELLQDGYEVVVVDNCYNGSPEALHRIELICGRMAPFEKVDLRDFEALNGIFKKYPKISSVIHFAALKAVGESGEKPLDYYDTNIGGTVSLLKAMEKNNVRKIVFSSSATVYGDASKYKDMIPIPEDCPLSATNVYAETKIAIENCMFPLVNNSHQYYEHSVKHVLIILRRCCVTSIPLAHTRRGYSVKIPMEFPTTSFPCSHM